MHLKYTENRIIIPKMFVANFEVLVILSQYYCYLSKLYLIIRYIISFCEGRDILLNCSICILCVLYKY